MTRADLELLAQRVEREEPSEELGIAVAAACGKGLSHFGSGDDAVYVNPMRYLRSLDAAASLVDPVRCRWSIRTGDRSNAEVYDDNALMHGDRFKVEGNAAHPAAALTAAALRAMAMEAKDE